MSYLNPYYSAIMGSPSTGRIVVKGHLPLQIVSLGDGYVDETIARERATALSRGEMASDIPNTSEVEMPHYYAVVWTKRSGAQGEFHFSCWDVANTAATHFRTGWRKDARVERRYGHKG